MRCIVCNEIIDYGDEYMSVINGYVCWSCINDLVEKELHNRTEVETDKEGE